MPMSFSSAQDLESHLEKTLQSTDLPKDRQAFNTFDMEGDTALLDPKTFSYLHTALTFLDAELKPKWLEFDNEANAQQTSHNRIARTAIVCGVMAVILVLLQFGLQETPGGFSSVVGWVEIVSAAVAAGAVALGIVTGCDRKWLIARHKAERLRILKFRALGRSETWCGPEKEWQKWVRESIAEIQSISQIKDIEDWINKVAASPHEPKPSACTISSGEVQALASYYRWKRVGHQIRYYNHKAKTILGRKRASSAQDAGDHLPSGNRHRHGVWLFFISIMMVIAHVVMEKLSGHNEHGLMHLFGGWFLALAGLIPVIGFGCRAWKGAFEPARSAALCIAKSRSLELNARNLVNTQTDLQDTMHHIAHIEHFFEHEHSEWLRLMLETDWLP